MRFKVVIIGSGAGGAALAYRLSCDPDVSVLVLEAGPDSRPDVVAIPARWPEALGGELDWGHRSVPQPGLNGRVLDYFRGRILGGSTAVNAMIHAIPTADDLAPWGAAWQLDDVAVALRGLDGHRGTGFGRGGDGPARNAPAQTPNPLSVAFVEASVDAGYKRVADLNGGDEDGVGWMDLALTEDNLRADAATVYLRSAFNRPNLEIRCGVTAEQLVLDGDRVRAVRLRSVDGSQQELATDDAELVLCAGAVDTPALLLRSGIGPREQLSEAGIDTNIELPGVGANLHDHPAVPVVWRSNEPLQPPTAQWFESQLILRHDDRVAGGALGIAFGHVAYGMPDEPNGASALIGLYRPFSRGTLALDPADPFGPLRIDPAMLTDPRDRAAARAGIRIVRAIAERAPLKRFGLTELLPAVGDDALDDVIAETTGSFAHPVGTCALGDGPGAVVNRELKLHGVQNVRVADASVFPSIPSAATSVTTQMVGWRLADMLLR